MQNNIFLAKLKVIPAKHTESIVFRNQPTSLLPVPEHVAEWEWMCFFGTAYVVECGTGQGGRVLSMEPPASPWLQEGLNIFPLGVLAVFIKGRGRGGRLSRSTLLTNMLSSVPLSEGTDNEMEESPLRLFLFRVADRGLVEKLEGGEWWERSSLLPNTSGMVS